MGCDIHARLEIKLGDVWSMHLDKDGEPLEPFYHRNYRLFAMLANVRNSGNIIPISPRKGVPRDVSIEVNDFIKAFGADGHSHSYLTLEDLLNYDLLKEINETGFVDFKEFISWYPFRGKDNSGPRSWSSIVFGSKTKILTELEAIKLYEELEDKAGDNSQKLSDLIKENDTISVDCSWTETYSNIAGEMLTRAIPMMTSLCINLGLRHDEVRVVFFFDN